MEQFHPPVHPEVPNRPQGPREQGKKQNAAAQTSQQDEPPELAIRLPQDEQKDRQTYGLTVEQVQRRRQSGVPQPHRPQQVVQDPGTQTQQNRQEERAERSVTWMAMAYPNRRLKKPP